MPEYISSLLKKFEQLQETSDCLLQDSTSFGRANNCTSDTWAIPEVVLQQSSQPSLNPDAKYFVPIAKHIFCSEEVMEHNVSQQMQYAARLIHSYTVLIEQAAVSSK